MVCLLPVLAFVLLLVVVRTCLAGSFTAAAALTVPDRAAPGTAIGAANQADLLLAQLAKSISAHCRSGGATGGAGWSDVAANKWH